MTASSALIGWSQPVAPMDKVTMSYGPASDPSNQTSVDVFPPDKQYSVGGLKPDTEYKVSLISKSGDATSDPVTTTFTTGSRLIAVHADSAEIINAVCVFIVNNVFTVALDAPTDLQAMSQTDDSITLEWTNSQADVESYLVKYSPISGATHGEELVPRGPGVSTTATITGTGQTNATTHSLCQSYHVVSFLLSFFAAGLKPGTEYGIGVTAVKNERESLPATTNAATGERRSRAAAVQTLILNTPFINVHRLEFVDRNRVTK